MSVNVSKQTLGRVLQSHRKTRGLTIANLADRAGIHRITLSRWERDQTYPRIYELRGLLKELNLNQSEILACYQRLEAPRALQIAATGASAALPVSSGELLRALRRRSRLSQRAIACAVGVAQSLVVKWEQGECWPGNEQLHGFCFAIGASQDELIFLTTRAWQRLEPLPQNREALDDWLHQGRDDGDTIWAGVYLALAARYQSLFRMGKIGEFEALAMHAPYADYLAWRLQRFEEAKRIVGPILASLPRTRGALTLGQRMAVNCQVAYDDAFGNERRNVARNVGSKKLWEGNLSLLESLSPRFPAEAKPLYRRLLAQNWEKMGNGKSADANYRENIASASSQRGAQSQSWAYVEFLCRQGRFRDALPVLIAPANLPVDAPPLVSVKHWCNHAEVYAGLGDHAAARSSLAQAVRCAHQHGDPSLSEHEFSRIGTQIK